MCQSVPEGYNQEKLDPHKYPIWILAFSGVIVVLILISLISVPGDLAAGKEIRRAQRLEKDGKPKQAAEIFKSVLDKHPGSMAARMGAVKAILAQKNPTEDMKALELLKDMPLDKYDVRELEEVMPEKYWQLFEEHGKKEVIYKGS